MSEAPKIPSCPHDTMIIKAIVSAADKKPVPPLTNLSQTLSTMKSTSTITATTSLATLPTLRLGMVTPSGLEKENETTPPELTNVDQVVDTSSPAAASTSSSRTLLSTSTSTNKRIN